MQKTLLDEFAMAAMQGWISSIKDPSTNIDGTKAAASFYDLAQCMMAERAKRMPAAAIAEVEAADPLPLAAAPESLLTAISSLRGRKVTCSEICQKAYGWLGDMTALREIGATLRGMGYQKVRSGGKDYYQL